MNLPQFRDCKLISLKVEWRCAESGNSLKVLVNDVVIPVFVGKNEFKGFQMLRQRNNTAVLLFTILVKKLKNLLNYCCFSYFRISPHAYKITQIDILYVSSWDAFYFYFLFPSFQALSSMLFPHCQVQLSIKV